MLEEENFELEKDIALMNTYLCIQSRNSGKIYFGGALKLLQMVTAVMKLKDACTLEEKL